MEKLGIRKMMNSKEKYKKVWESDNLSHRILYFQLDKEDEGIPAHFHPYGEDHAIVLQGELTYDISFHKQIKAVENEIVFGWNQCIHGYQNCSDEPLHLLVFATPEHNPSMYSKGEEKHVEKIRKAKIDKNFRSIASERIQFSTEIAGNLNYIFAYDKEEKELEAISAYQDILKLQFIIQFINSK